MTMDAYSKMDGCRILAGGVSKCCEYYQCILPPREKQIAKNGALFWGQQLENIWFILVYYLLTNLQNIACYENTFANT